MKIILIFKIAIFLSIFSIGCDTNQKAFDQQSNEIEKIKIINKTLNTFNKKETIIKDSINVNLIKDQLNLMKKISNANVKASTGFYELQLYYKDGKQEDFGIIYTTYDGVVIYDYNSNLEYKNDRLEQLMVNFLSN